MAKKRKFTAKGPPEIERNCRQLITVKRAAEIAGVKVSAIYNRIRRGALPAYRRGRLWIRIDQDELQAF